MQGVTITFSDIVLPKSDALLCRFCSFIRVVFGHVLVTLAYLCCVVLFSRSCVFLSTRLETDLVEICDFLGALLVLRRFGGILEQQKVLSRGQRESYPKPTVCIGHLFSSTSRLRRAKPFGGGDVGQWCRFCFPMAEISVLKWGVECRPKNIYVGFSLDFCWGCCFPFLVFLQL